MGIPNAPYLEVTEEAIYTCGRSHDTEAKTWEQMLFMCAEALILDEVITSQEKILKHLEDVHVITYPELDERYALQITEDEMGELVGSCDEFSEGVGVVAVTVIVIAALVAFIMLKTMLGGKVCLEQLSDSRGVLLFQTLFSNLSPMGLTSIRHFYTGIILCLYIK
ncbi:hypothetical protein OPQ81_011894 [Rhizoctonia solani]|nr:hypothetical protein OPQ81_011894 [Rhizoctonia solani]